MTLFMLVLWLSAVVFGVWSFILIARDPIPPSLRTAKLLTLFGVGVVTVLLLSLAPVILS